jgi:hypothetical protein
MSDIDAIKRVLLGERDDRMRKLDMLVRQGMMSPAQLPMLHRGLEKLQQGKTLNPNERASVAKVMDSLLYIVTGDDTVFQKAKMHTQKTRYQTEEAELTEEEFELDMFSESYKTGHKSYTDAVNHAFDHHAKSGLTSSQDDKAQHIGLDSKRPGSGKTTRVNIPATHKSGKKHMIHMQVYNKGGTHPYELNTYSSTTRKMQKEELETIEEKNTPTDPKLWASKVAAAKSKFDVYPSAYANGWAAKEYKKAGGGWKSEAKEEVEQVQEELPDHLKKILDKKGNIDPKKVPGAKKSSAKVTDVTPKGYGPKEEVELDEKVKDMSMGDVIKDFQKSDAPQFKDKSKEKKREMAIAAKLSADEANDMETEEIISENPLIAGAARALGSRFAAKKGAGKAGQAVAGHVASKAASSLTSRNEESEQDEEDLKEYITSKQVKMAKGIANDPRHKGGDMTGAAKKMEKIKKGLSNHPGAQKALRQANEDFADYTDEEFDELIEMSYKDKFQAMLKKKGKSLADMSDDEKKGFFNSVDVAHKAKNEDTEIDEAIKLKGFGKDAGPSNMSNPAARASLMKSTPAVKKKVSDMTPAEKMANTARRKEYNAYQKSKRNEEVEQVDELKKSTLSSYIQKAVDPTKKKSNVNLASKAAHKLATSDDMNAGEKEDRKAFVRSKGIQTAAKKLAKEEAEQIDEITAAQQAARDAKSPGAMRGMAPTKKDKPDLVHKEPKKGQKQPHGEHIVVQMRKAITANKPVQFKDGTKKVVSKAHAHKFLSKYMSSKPAGKEEMHGAHDSHDSFMKHVNDK